MNVKALADVPTRHDVPETSIGSLQEFSPFASAGVSEYSIPIPDSGVLKGLFTNEGVGGV